MELKNRFEGCGFNYAAIDIGSNAVRLLIKHVEEDHEGKATFSKVLLLRVPLRLGFDVFGMGKLSEKKEKNMIRLMEAYQNLMVYQDLTAYRDLWVYQSFHPL